MGTAGLQEKILRRESGSGRRERTVRETETGSGSRRIAVDVRGAELES